MQEKVQDYTAIGWSNVQKITDGNLTQGVCIYLQVEHYKNNIATNHRKHRTKHIVAQRNYVSTV